ncbi:hypothetical protein QBC47DRAFT_16913 [Echria macrotheca]|uniref:FAD synthase n=1 Tax=Echria macrotheca TaxID=438768 RepID=A0AAJ0FB97_9PEZI|nr:hypothetical protein QBC47DRAFT_16913 [Echria macrotheca]
MSNAGMTQDAVPRINGVARPADAPRAAAADVPRTPSSKPAPATSKSNGHTRSLPEICYVLRRKVTAFLDEQPGDDGLLRDTQAQARIAMGVIEEALHRYGPDELSLAYNGGKDCLVLLILILACLPALLPPASSSSSSSTSTTTPTSTSTNTTTDPAEQQEQKPAPQNGTPSSLSSVETVPAPPQPLQAIYIAPPDPFPEVEEFVATSTREYHLDLVRYGLPMRRALEAYLGDRPAVRAIFMGTRRTDPHSEFLAHFSPTDADWPQFMRVNPLLDWHYAEIWTFIRHLELSFCCLYDQGFSSLGGMTNTRPNPALALDGSGGKAFRPAYELVRDDEERLGRDR